MKVIHINSDYGNTIYKSLSDHLFTIGVDQRVFKFVRQNNFPAVKYDEYVDVRLNYGNIDRYIFHIKHQKVLNDFYSYVKKKEVDILHAHTLFSNGYIAYKNFKKTGTPYIVTVRGTDVSVFFRLMLHLRKTGLEILECASKIIFISHAHKKTVFNNYIPNELKENLLEKTIVIPNGIDSVFFNEKKDIKVNNCNEKVVITAAWINDNKNQINVAKAIELLNVKGYNIKYKIVGGVERKNTYKKLLEELKSYSFVEIMPRKSKLELIEEYRKADVFAMISVKETFGLSYIEALTQGLPVIYTKNQGIDGYFEEGTVGYHADPTNPSDIANKLEKVLNKDFFLSENIINDLDQFKWANIAKIYKQIYTEIIQEVK